MRISTKLKFAALAPLAMVLAMAAGILIGHRTIQVAQEKGRSAERIIRSMNDLHSLVAVYSLHHEERARQQFLALHASTVSMLASIHFTKSEQQRLLKVIRENTDTMRDSFVKMVAIHESAQSTPGAAGYERDEDRLAGQLLVRSRQAVFDGLRLERLVNAQIALTQSKINVLIAVLTLLVMVPVTLVLLHMMGRIGRSMGRLHQSTEIVGQGSMDHRIGLSGEDELAELARAFDLMTEKLQALTVSRDELEREVATRKQAEHELQRAKDELSKINANLELLVTERTAKLQELVGELEHFSYTITHDMRAPLRAMRGFGELVNDLCASCEHAERKDFIRKIMTSAGRMDCLITDALSYSRTVRQELPAEEVDIGALLRGMLDSYPELQASKASITIKGELPRVVGNQAGLTQCLSNLLGNAVKFVKPGHTPEILIRSEAVRDGQQRYGSGEWVRIWVEDRGIGISQRMLPKVFDMFSRGSNTHEGTGIGLALVRKVTQRMGGRVGVDSEEGKGSRFWIELKAAEN